jgi:biopolymer transport protein ExbD/biopolymer transport protein TolR
MEFRTKKRALSRIEITPLIDVVLLLLIFFMISTTFVTTPGIKVKLPQAATQAATREQDIVVVVTEEGQLYFNNRRVTLDRLRLGLKEEVSKGGKDLLIVKADKESKHGRVVEVMDLAQQVGISRIAIATEPVKKK